MTLAPVLFASLTTIAAASQGHDFAVREIDRTYDAKIEAHKTSGGLSLFGCQVEEYVIWGQDPVSFKARPINVSLYRARAGTMTGASVIILPPTGGVNILDRGYSNELCSSGITAALLPSWEHQGDTSLDFSMHNNGALRSLAATRHVVEFLRSQNLQSIGVLGTSIGAIAGALAFGVEPRISARPSLSAVDALQTSLQKVTRLERQA